MAPKADPASELPIVTFASCEEWGAWLEAAGAGGAGVWLRLAKRGAPTATISYDQALEVALCHGWIDGQKGKLDEHYWMQRFSPRKRTSRWSARNREKALELIEQGAMRPSGLAEIQRAKRDGRWAAAYAGQRTAEVPDDFQEALDADQRAKRSFAALKRSERYSILYRIDAAKRPQTRARKIEEYVAKLSEERALDT